MFLADLGSLGAGFGKVKFHAFEGDFEHFGGVARVYLEPGLG